MYRIVAVMACAAVLAGLTFTPASAVTCDDRVAGSCPIEPVVEQAEANADAVSVKPLAYARADKERGVRRARRASRTLSRGERRRTATAVASALAREREPVRAAPRRQQIQVEPQQSVEAPAASLANAAAPAAATILAPNFVQTIDLRRPRLDASSLVVADASAQVAERARPDGGSRTACSGRWALAALRLPRVRGSARFGLGDPAVRLATVGRMRP
jgi:hypothetical protein